eukprot:495778_1
MKHDTTLLSIFYIFLFILYVNNAYIDIYCGDFVSDYVYGNETHYYRLILNDTYDVNFDTCLEHYVNNTSNVYDITLDVKDESNNSVSEQACPSGDSCGNCTNNISDAEYFTIPLGAGIHFIEINSTWKRFNLDSSYTLQISCINIPINNSVFMTTPIDNTLNQTTPISTVIYTTYVPIEFKKLNNCDYYSNETFEIFTANILTDLYLKNGTVELSLYIKFNRNCDDEEGCNILSLHNYDDDIDVLSLSIGPFGFFLEITTATNMWPFYETYRIPNITSLLAIDGQYHLLNLKHTFSLNSTSQSQNKNSLKINDAIYYYSTSSSLTATTWQKYQLYASSPDHNPANMSILAICVKGIQFLPAGGIQIPEIKCGGKLNGTRDSLFDSDYVFLNVSEESSVLFNASFSEYDTWLILEDITDAFYGEGKNQLFRQKLFPGEYILEITTWYDRNLSQNEWILYVDCNATFVDPSRYKLVVSYVWNNDYSWNYAERQCEISWGTSLATIITENDMEFALMDTKYQYQGDSSDLFNADIWIGLYRFMNNHTYDSSWNWVNGESCNYTETNNCMNDPHWSTNQPDNKPSLLHDQELVEQYGAALRINATGIDAAFFDFPFNFPMNVHPVTDSISSFMLCNAPNSNYGIKMCKDKVNCWHRMNCCNDTHLEKDISKDYGPNSNAIEFYAPIAYWNDTLFVVGKKEIHYSDVTTIHQKHYNWKYKDLNFQQLLTEGLAQRYSQHKSSLFLYVFDYSSHDMLVNIDLESFKVNIISLPPNYPSVRGDDLLKYCLVSTDQYVYVLRKQMMLIYDMNINEWDIKPFEDREPMSCAATFDEKYIYSFTDTDIIKYDTNTTAFHAIDTMNICSFNESGFNKAITGRDGRIYIHGCHVTAWKTAVFNPKYEQFENTIGIDIPTVPNVPYYRASQLTMFDDNILLLFQQRYDRYPLELEIYSEDYISLYYGITHIISINFALSVIDLPIWPSDGFMIRYNLNDFRNVTKQIYEVILYFDNTKHPIIESIVLSVLKDNCACISTYKCYNCSQYFNTSNYLSTAENELNHLKFIPSTCTSEFHCSALVLPESFNIALQRCEISLTLINNTISNKDLSIHFAFTLSENCFTRDGAQFSLQIDAERVNISSKLHVTIHDNYYSCNLCLVGRNNVTVCDSCSDGMFIIFAVAQHTAAAFTFNITIESMHIDFRVVSKAINTAFFVSDDTTIITNDQMNFYLLLLLLLLLIPIIIICCLYQAYTDAFIVKEALVLIIGISEFQDESRNLLGVSTCVQQLQSLWKNKYNYDVFICNEDTWNCDKNGVISFVDTHLKKMYHKLYDSVIIHLISHGDDGYFFASDDKALAMEFFTHEIVNKCEDLKHPNLIKLIFHHGCQGKNDYRSPDIAAALTDSKLMTKNISMPKLNNKMKNLQSTTEKMTYDSNCLIITANISGRGVSDNGGFTDCICNAFEENANKIVKADLNTLLVKIGQDLEQNSKHSEIPVVKGTIRYGQVRFEKSKVVANKLSNNAIEMGIAIKTNK